MSALAHAKPTAGQPRPAPRPVQETAERVLLLSGVKKSFAARRVLEDVSFSVSTGEIVALCGPSGCGKTTLLRIICGLTPFQGGSMTIGGSRIAADAPYPGGLYGRVGMVFQEHSLFPHMTALENVMLALRDVKRLSRAAARERSLEELARMGVVDRARNYPATLSGGERQRVAVARALALDPLLLLLDEPTAQLDPDRVQDVGEHILALSERGTTMVLVTHNMDLARRVASRFVILAAGASQVSVGTDRPAEVSFARGPRP